MRITRLYTGDDGKSHFEDIDMPTYSERYYETTDPIPAKEVAFRTVKPGRVEPWHTPPYRHYVTFVTGHCEIEIGDGTRRMFGPGEIILSEDTTGQGHYSRWTDEPCFLVGVPAAD